MSTLLSISAVWRPLLEGMGLAVLWAGGALAWAWR
jgi:hypothetical protein